MKLIDGYYVDSNNNKWNACRYTEEQAIKVSNSLIDCYDCVDCENCFECIDCKDCEDCIDCKDCEDCIRCEFCSNCDFCIDCAECEYCSDLVDACELKYQTK
ncbi:hypothetical protein ACNGEM_08215 [Campylobacter coli]